MDYDLLIVNGVVVTDTETGEYDIGIKDEKIQALEPRGKLSGASARRTIDVKGGWVMVRFFGKNSSKPSTDQISRAE